MTFRTKRLVKVVILAGAVALTGTSLSAGTPPGKERRPPDTLWQTDGFGTTSLEFIPESVLNEAIKSHYATLGLPAHWFPYIEQSIRFAKDRQAVGQSTCTQGIIGAVPAGAGAPMPEGLDALDASHLVFVGTVEALVGGVMVSGDAATLVKIRVTQILKDNRATHVRDRLTLLERIGRAKVDGTELCTANPYYRLPRVGEEVVVGGDADPENSANLRADEHRVFFVKDGIVDRGAIEPEKWKPISLADLNQDLNRILVR